MESGGARTAGNEMVTAKKSDKLGETLMRLGIVNAQQLDIALQKQAATGDYLGEILIHLGYASATDVYRVLSRQRGIPYVDVALVDIPPEVLDAIPREFAEKYTVLPLAVEGDAIRIAVADHLDVMAFDDISQLTRMQPAFVLSSRREIRKAIRENYSRPSETEKQIERILSEQAAIEVKHQQQLLQSKEPEQPVAGNSPAVRFVDIMLQQAVDRKASDLHIEPHKDSVTLRYRIDGILHEAAAPTRSLHEAIVSRVKILANLDIAERRLPQDGRFHMRDLDVDVRVSIIPTIHGEKIQMRFLDQSRLVLEFETLGLTDSQRAVYAEALQQSQGMI